VSVCNHVSVGGADNCANWSQKDIMHAADRSVVGRSTLSWTVKTAVDSSVEMLSNT